MFIAFEGCGGTGKSYQAKKICDLLEGEGKEIIYTKEVMCLGYHSAVIEHWQKFSDPMTQLLLFAAVRRQHYLSVIQPALARNKWVICDRFSLSTEVYQGQYTLGNKLLPHLQELVWDNLKPNFTFIFDASVETVQTRIEQDEDKGRRIPSGQSSEDFQKSFLAARGEFLRHSEKMNHFLIDAELPKAEVTDIVKKKIDYLKRVYKRTPGVEYNSS